MKYFILLLVLAGCSSTGPMYSSGRNSLDPTPNKIACPAGSVVVVDKHGGGRMKSVGGERWSCEDPDAIDYASMEDEQDWMD